MGVGLWGVNDDFGAVDVGEHAAGVVGVGASRDAGRWEETGKF